MKKEWKLLDSLFTVTACSFCNCRCNLRSSGVLSANQTDFVSPAVMHWTRSGDLIIMVVLGGMGTFLVQLLVQSHFCFWKNFFRVSRNTGSFFWSMLVLIVIFGQGGIDGILVRLEKWWQIKNLHKF
ncbi:MAG: hypothetical protein CM1200mP30_06980 [Pseudomonadota bacterium]|nr:MAG: hypothetical protein CM1200mP30_06980 [Pseudomonadota bacterium]